MNFIKRFFVSGEFTEALLEEVSSDEFPDYVPGSQIRTLRNSESLTGNTYIHVRWLAEAARIEILTNITNLPEAYAHYFRKSGINRISAIILSKEWLVALLVRKPQEPPWSYLYGTVLEENQVIEIFGDNREDSVCSITTMHVGTLDAVHHIVARAKTDFYALDYEQAYDVLMDILAHALE